MIIYFYAMHESTTSYTKSQFLQMEEEGTPHSSNYRLVFAINKPPEDRIW